MIRWILGIFTAITAALGFAWRRSEKKVKQMEKQNEAQQTEVKKTNEEILKEAEEAATKPVDYEKIDNDLQTAHDSGDYDAPFNESILPMDDKKN